MIKKNGTKIQQLQRTFHKLNLFKNGIKAYGFLAGNFYEQIGITSESKVSFSGNFEGFFERVKQTQTHQYYFEGKIFNFRLTQDDNQQIFEQNFFSGYFKGRIYDCDLDGDHINNNSSDLFLRKPLNIFGRHDIFQEGKKTQYHVPTFVRMLVKKLSNIHLKENFAQVDATVVIDIRFNEGIMEQIYHKENQKKKIQVTFNLENYLELPLREGTFSINDADIDVQVNQKLCNFHYVIRNVFSMKIDPSYEQFFTPFSLTYLKMNMYFHSIRFRNFAKVNFICCDLDDYRKDEYYTPYNDLLEHKQSGKIINRLTKIKIKQRQISEGEYKICKNHVYLFPSYKATFKNTDKLRSDYFWQLGLINRDSYFQMPTVKSIKGQYEKRKLEDELGKQRKTHLFKVDKWNMVHAEISIYRYLVISLFQIFIPLLVLSVLGLFIFLEQSGQGQQLLNVLTFRIVNAATIILAYVGLIPIIRETMPQTSVFTLVYIILYLSTIPNLLVLIRSLIDREVINKEFLQTYSAFMDGIFLASFSLVCLLMSVLFVVIIYFYFQKKDIQIGFSYVDYRKFEDVKYPRNYDKYYNLIKALRSQQYKVTYTDDYSVGMIIKDLLVYFSS